MKTIFITIYLSLGATLSSAQILTLPQATAQEEITIPTYDSLTNFTSSYEFSYLKGQTLYLAKADSYSSSYSSNLRNFYDNSCIDMNTMVGKYLRVEEVRGTEYDQSLILRDTTDLQTYTYKIHSYSNNCWIVMGYYEKMKQLYVGKDLILMQYESFNTSIYKDYPMYRLDTHKKLDNVKTKTRWKCTGLTVDTELSDNDIKNRLLLLIENKEYGQCYCFVDSRCNLLNSKNEYKRESSYSVYYIAEKFMPGEVYDRQQRQAQAKKQEAAAAEKKAQQKRQARQRANAEAVLKGQQRSH